MEQAEQILHAVVHGLRLAVEATGALVVAMGIGIAAWQFAGALLARRTANFTAQRLVLARYLALALEFQLGADILSTAVAPTWQDIGRLAAVAVIRTGLNYFLSREMREARATARGEQTVGADADKSAAGAGAEPGPAAA